MRVSGFDHIVLCVVDVSATLKFYEDMLGMQRCQERPGKWSLHFGQNKISIQDVSSVPDIARGTVRGSGNFCVLTQEPIDEYVYFLRTHGVEILDGPIEKDGAMGKIYSVYFNDTDGNLVEVANQL